MRTVQALGLALGLGLAVSGCGDDDTQTEPVAEQNPYEGDYFEDGGYIMPRSHVNVVRALGIAGELEPGVAEGFDLDERSSPPGEEDSCQHGDAVSPDGQEGIDNQFGRMWPAIEPLVGEAVEGLLQGAINEGRILMMMELADLDDLQNDDNVTFNIYRGSLDPQIGTFGLIAPDQTFRIDDSFPLTSVEGLKLENGELVAGPVPIQFPIDILDARFNMNIQDALVRVQIHDDGSFTGVIGGAFSVPDVIGELLMTGAAAETRLVAPAFEANADMGRDEDGTCNLLSAAFVFEGTTAFVVRDAQDPTGAP